MNPDRTDAASQEYSPFRLAAGRFFHDRLATVSLFFIAILFFTAVLAPLIANGKPLLTDLGGALRSPALRDFFAPDCQEALVERLFNYLLPAIPAAVIFLLCSRRWRTGVRVPVLSALLILIALPFLLCRSVSDHTDWREWKAREPGALCIFTVCPLSP